MTGKSSSNRHRQCGAVMLVAMIFLLIFSALAVSMATMANSNTQLASNQHKANAALLAAQSGLECAKYVVRTVTLPSTGTNTVSDTEADTVWTTLYTYLQTLAMDGQPVPASSRLDTNDGDQVILSSMSLGQAFGTFSLRFYRYDADPRTIKMEATGVDGPVTRTVTMDMQITKDSSVLNYGIATRGRTWLTGNTTVYGDIFSSWDVASISPFNMTSDSTVYGTINTVLGLDQIEAESYQMETLNADDLPIDANGNPLGTHYEDRYYGSNDEIQAYHEGINYDQPDQTNIPGMDIDDYDTTAYKAMVNYTAAATVSGSLISNGQIPTSTTTVTEYFPHAAGSYTTSGGSGSLQVKRYVYENKTFENVFLPSIKTSTTNRRAALFTNCTFEGVLYIDCSQTKASTTTNTPTNNVRFENCTFNGVIVTNTPRSLWTNWWMQNCLYFTGTAAFNNQSSVQEATILAPQFNVNLGNTNSDQDDNNVLTGAIVGGIVDIRGNAQIYGTIISMTDTTGYSSGYVSNIGATLEDGGSETTELGDVGVITITEPAEEDKRLPSGITTPIVIKPTLNTYTEGA
jgi:hypothetical protein